MKTYNNIMTSMIVIQVIYRVCFINIVTAQTLEWKPGQSYGDWSSAAISLIESNADDSTAYKILPKAKKGISEIIKKNRVIYVIRNDNILKSNDELGIQALGELLWSENLHYFVLTQSDGGWVGSWYTSVYIIGSDSVNILDISKSVKQSFMKKYKCTETEEPNIGAIKWLNNDTELLLVAEVPPHSNCPEMGKLRGYVVMVPTGTIIKEYDEKKLKNDWGKYLGQRFIQKK